MADAALMDAPAPTALPDTVPGTPVQPEAPANPLDDEIVQHIRGQLGPAMETRRKRIQIWKRNVELRAGKETDALTTGGTLDEQSGDNNLRAEINPDWSRTKTKTAQLFSQVPEVQMTHEDEMAKPAIPAFRKAVNKQLEASRVDAAMNEALADIVNMSGICAIYVGYAERMGMVEQPAMDFSVMPPQLQQMMGGQIPMVSVPRVVSRRVPCVRISPADLLIPDGFVGSDFDQCPWIGREITDGSWATVKNEFKLDDSWKERLQEAGDRPQDQSTREDAEGANATTMLHAVKYQDLYYFRYLYDPDEPYMDRIYRLVLSSNVDNPPIYHGPWDGQQFDPQTGYYVGNCTYPIRVATLTYISDRAVPPSDTEAGRPHVIDMRRSRRQMFKQRDRSYPLRWINSDRADHNMVERIRQGEYLDTIITQGPGDKVVGEVARATYPAENLQFDRQAQADLDASWQIGANQMGISQPGERTAAESRITQGNFNIRINQERAFISRLFLSVAQQIAGQLVLHSEFEMLPEKERQALVSRQGWDYRRISHNLILKIRPDSTIMLDVDSRLDKLMKYVDMTAKSGFLQPQGVLEEIAELCGRDPAVDIKPPQPKPPDPPTVSLRLSGVADLLNPAVMAQMVHSGHAPTPEDLATAIKILQATQQAMASLGMAMPADPNAPPTPGDASPRRADAPVGGGTAIPGAVPPPSLPPGGPPVSDRDPANPGWGLMDKVSARAEDIGAV